MFSVLKKISDFAGTRRGLLKKSMAVAFLGAVFAALQFAALMDCVGGRIAIGQN